MVEFLPAVQTPELTERDAQELNTLIYNKVREVEQSFYHLGDMLYAAWQGQIWKALGLDSWEQWLAGMRLFKGVASDMIRSKELRLAYPEYEPRILDTNPSNMRLLLPHLQQDRETRVWNLDDDTLDEMLEKANTRPYRQLRDELNNGTDPFEPPALYPFVCPYCHKEMQVTTPNLKVKA